MFDIPESIVDAIERDDFECVGKYAGELDSDKKDMEKGAMLMHAVYTANAKMTSFLVNLGTNVDFVNKRGTTALMVASSVGDIRLVRALIRKKANAHLTDELGRSALVNAIQGEHHDVISYLAPIVFSDSETKYAEVALSHIFPRKTGHPENYPHIALVSNIFSAYYLPRSMRDASFGEDMARDLKEILGRKAEGWKPIFPEGDRAFLEWCAKSLSEQERMPETPCGKEP